MLSTVERLKIAIEEVAALRTGCTLEWQEKLDLEARTIAVGFVSQAEHHTLGRKLKNVEEVEFEAKAESWARAAGTEPTPYMPELLKPVAEDRIDFYRIEILRALLREGAVNLKF